MAKISLSERESQPKPTDPRFHDLEGLEFGRWTVLAYVGRWHNQHYWRCRCTCSRVRVVYGGRLVGKRSESCGCWRRERLATLRTRHGESGQRDGKGGKTGTTVAYRAWTKMHDRCGNANGPDWLDYGGRGIKVCRRWAKFENFLADMGRCPAGLSLDREDTHGNYSPGNCRWATAKTQSRNRRNVRKYHYLGRNWAFPELVEHSGLKAETLRFRLNRGEQLPYALRPVRSAASETTRKQKAAARFAVRDAVVAGKLVRPSICPNCKKIPTRPVQAHHHNGYDREHWLDVVWLCNACHRQAEHSISAFEPAP